MNRAACTVENGRIETPKGPLLRDLSFEIAQRKTTVLLGPAGIGKSLLLHQVAGRGLPPGWTRKGEWRLGEGIRAAEGVRLVEQARRGCASEQEQRRRTLADAFASSAPLLLLDEPTRGISDEARPWLVRQLLDARGKRTIIAITHDLEFARQVGDFAHLFCAGQLVASGAIGEMFDSPPSELCRRFLAQGNCWPQAAPPPLPSHFQWLVEGQLAGMGRPGLLAPIEHDLEAIATAGIEILVSLTKVPISANELRHYGIEGQHLPIEDMGIPAVGPMRRILGRVKRAMSHGRGVAVHCQAGLGRTGTILAAHLITQGADADTAITQVRSKNPNFIQSRVQEEFLQRFAADCLS